MAAMATSPVTAVSGSASSGGPGVLRQLLAMVLTGKSLALALPRWPSLPQVARTLPRAEARSPRLALAAHAAARGAPQAARRRQI